MLKIYPSGQVQSGLFQIKVKHLIIVNYGEKVSNANCHPSQTYFKGTVNKYFICFLVPTANTGYLS